MKFDLWARKRQNMWRLYIRNHGQTIILAEDRSMDKIESFHHKILKECEKYGRVKVLLDYYRRAKLGPIRL